MFQTLGHASWINFIAHVQFLSRIVIDIFLYYSHRSFQKLYKYILEVDHFNSHGPYCQLPEVLLQLLAAYQAIELDTSDIHPLWTADFIYHRLHIPHLEILHPPLGGRHHHYQTNRPIQCVVQSTLLLASDHQFKHPVSKMPTWSSLYRSSWTTYFPATLSRSSSLDQALPPSTSTDCHSSLVDL